MEVLWFIWLVALRKEDTVLLMTWAFVDELKGLTDTVDGIVLNAGVMYVPKYWLTKYGHEYIWECRDVGRIVIVSSNAHRWINDLNIYEIDRPNYWNSVKAYGRSKLAQVMYTVIRALMLRRERKL
ncbi:WW domain-containing oxidoreductase, partial [Trichinella pseudospiralis]